MDTVIVTSIVRGEFAGTHPMFAEQFQATYHPSLWLQVASQLETKSTAEVTLYWTDTKGWHTEQGEAAYA